MNALLQYFIPKQIKIKTLLLGWDNAGKTTILKALLGETVQNLPPTKGFNFQIVDYKNYKFEIWDWGGQKAIRNLWENYYEKIDAWIYVIDSSDNYRIEETGSELYGIMQQPEWSGIPIAVFANKQDWNLSWTPEEIMDELNLNCIMDRKWTIVATSAVTKTGIMSGWGWWAECWCNNGNE